VGAGEAPSRPAASATVAAAAVPVSRDFKGRDEDSAAQEDRATRKWERSAFKRIKPLGLGTPGPDETVRAGDRRSVITASRKYSEQKTEGQCPGLTIIT